MTVNSQDAVAESLQNSGDWEGLAGHLRERMMSGDPAYHSVATRLATVLETQLDRPGKAGDVLEWLLDKAPADVDIRHTLERLRSETQNWSGLVVAYRRGLVTAADDTEKIVTLEKILRVQRDALGDTDALRATCIEALSLEPSCQWAWSNIEQSHAADESWWELIKELAQAAMNAGDKSGPITFHIATVMDEHLGQLEKAATLYEAALTAGADPLSCLDALEALYAESEDWTQLVQTYERLMPLASDPEERTTLRRNWAMVLSDGLNDTKGAIALYDAILEDDPADKEAFQAMMALQKRTG
jgi:golgin subfamily B member 1